MTDLKEKVAVIGAGCCKFGENYHQSAEDMIVDAAFEAYADAGLEPTQIQAAWVGTLTSGASGVALADPLKLFEVSQHLWNKAGDRQVKNAEVGLAHNLGGPGSVACVTILSN